MGLLASIGIERPVGLKKRHRSLLPWQSRRDDARRSIDAGLLSIILKVQDSDNILVSAVLKYSAVAKSVRSSACYYAQPGGVAKDIAIGEIDGGSRGKCRYSSAVLKQHISSGVHHRRVFRNDGLIAHVRDHRVADSGIDGLEHVDAKSSPVYSSVIDHR